jgi:7,8-dihydropterin-6-yl-methyl-4-(beta-D-ribofuranosyl)aminobenzene 5'-phosphate synthase
MCIRSNLNPNIMKPFHMLAALLVTVTVLTSFHTPNPPIKMELTEEITLTILYDNYLYEEGFKNNWGFSCLIEGAGSTILFDTGSKDGILMHNFKAAGKDPQDVDMIILTHFHSDHTGGITEFLEANKGVDVYVPQSFPDEFIKGIEAQGAHPVIVSDAKKIRDNVWSTGEMGSRIIEQSLVIQTPRGLIIITGCAHPGIEKIVAKALEIRDEKILLVMGGFHLLQTGTDAVELMARDFKDKHIQYAAPTHCSGDETIKIFEEVFEEQYLKLGTGKVLQTADL